MDATTFSFEANKSIFKITIQKQGFSLTLKSSRTIASFIKMSSWHSLKIKLIFIKFFRTIWEIGGQMSWDWWLAESLQKYNVEKQQLYNIYSTIPTVSKTNERK
jgi:hypothetical protein